MRRISLVLSVVAASSLVFFASLAEAQDTSRTRVLLRLVASGVLRDSPFRFVDRKDGQHYVTPEKAPAGSDLWPDGPYTDWRYWNGVLNMAMIQVGEELKEPAYTEFAQRNIAFNFDSYGYFKNSYKDQGKWSYPFGQYFIMEELDDCGAMGASVIEVYRHDHQPRYREYIDKAANHVLLQQSRLDDGTLVRSFPQKWTLWADDLYMSISFLARMGELTGEGRYFNEATRQVINFHKYLFDAKSGLMHHCWYSDVKRPGIAFWGRANGWALMAQIDLLDRLPETHPQRDTVLSLLQKHIDGIAHYQSGEGLWHQLLDKTDSYLETSCSAMFTFAIARAVEKGYIEKRYGSIAKRGWEGVMSKIHPDGQIEGICTGTGVGDDLVFYYHRPAPLNDVHGVGAVLLAGIEVLRLQK
jgi:unsaturated rhamnogalacturonyl hydrolase